MHATRTGALMLAAFLSWPGPARPSSAAQQAAVVHGYRVVNPYPHDPAAAQSPVKWTVYLRRAGPARIGMSLSEVRRILADPQAALAWVGKEPDDSPCAYLRSAKIPQPLGFMFQHGRLVRIDVRGGDIRTASGAGIGVPKRRSRLCILVGFTWSRTATSRRADTT
jgi:hypothetical protein